MSYSGRCMLSAWLTGRSANLGDCVQPCRWNYKVAEVEDPNRPDMKMPVEEDDHGTYIFNSKDMCFIEYLDELIDSGIVSLKIEGRAKSVAYLSSVIKAYREGIDFINTEKDPPSLKLRRASKTKIKRKLKTLKKKYLDSLMHRGYTTGFLFGRDTVEQETKVSHLESKEEFVGEVIKSENGKIFIKPHNALRVGDKIRIIQPNENDLLLVIKKMYNEKDEEVESAHGGAGYMVYVKMRNYIEDFSILMRLK